MGVIVPFVMLVHAMPHIPGDSADGLAVYPELASRAVDGVQGDHYPYPIHVDEHVHLAWMNTIVRQGTADFTDPYTGSAESLDLGTVSGMRSERGWNVGIVQLSLLTDVPLVALARFLPAIWAGFLALGMYSVMRDRATGLVAASLVAILPTTVRSLGVGFLVPSAFGIVWVLATIMVAQRSNGAARFFGLALVITGASFVHLVIGILSLAAAIAATFCRSEPWVRRMGMLMAVAVPLLWIVPSALRDAQQALTLELELPFEQLVFLGLGRPFFVAAAVGAVLAFARPAHRNAPVRAMAIMAIPMALSIALSVENDHRNDGTYTRQLFVFMMMCAGPAAYGLVDGTRRLATLFARWRPAAPWQAIRWATIALTLLLYLPGPISATMESPLYRVHDERSWQNAQVLDDANLPEGTVFLSEPWAAQLYSAVSGGRPYTWLQNGVGPSNPGAWPQYTSTNGADAEWLSSRGIQVVVGLPPNAPHEHLGADVYKLRS